MCIAGGYVATERLTGHAAADEGGDGRQGEARATPVTVTTPDRRPIRDSFDTAGTALARRSIEVRPLSEGRVAEVAQPSGAEVAQGDLIFRLDDRAERAALRQARATLAEARSDFRRAEELQEENVVSEANLEAARARFRRAEAEVQQAEDRLADRRAEAPFAGVLGLIDLDQGELVGPEIAVTTLDDLSSVEVEFAMPERYFGRVEPGQRVALRGASYDGRMFEGRVDVVAPRVAPASRSFDVRAAVPNDDRALVDGMFLSARLIFDERRATTVPDDAIISEGEESYVFLVEDGVAVRREVTLGGRSDGFVEVDGVAPGARAVTSGYTHLSDGAPVRIAETATPVAERTQ